MSSFQVSSFDTLPEDHEYATYIKKVIRHRFRQSGFRRITTSLFEKTEHARIAYGENYSSISGTSDDEGNELVLRSEPKLPLARTYVENEMNQRPQPVELYYIDNFYKNIEGSNRIEEKLCFGVESIGIDDPALDAQIIAMASKVIDDLGLHEHFRVQINHLGCQSCRGTYFDDLTNFYFDKTRSLCECCVSLVESNPLQLLRCQEEDCNILAHTAPKLEHYLCDKCRGDYGMLKEFLLELEVEFDENKSVVGHQSFSDGTQFEFWDNNKGAARVIIWGGNAKSLIQKLGGEEPVSMTGFESDMNDLINCMKEEHIMVPHKDHLQIFVAQLGPNAKKKALALLTVLRDSGIQAVGAIGTGSMRIQLGLATSFGVKYTLLMGEVEVKEGMVIVRDMSVGSQESVPYDKAIKLVIDRIGKDKIDAMEDEEKSRSLKKKK
jgi:histidyl-tRNA synthetase